MTSISKLFCRVLQSVLKKLFLVKHLAQLGLKSDLHSLLKRVIDLLQMEDFILKFLNLVDVAHVLGV